MLTSKFRDGNTLFRKVTKDRIDMVILTDNHSVHIQSRNFDGNILYESNTGSLGTRRTALALIRGFFAIPMTFATY